MDRGCQYLRDKTCPEFALVWDTEFTLLGIKFTNTIDKMDENFKNKLSEIKKLYTSWLYKDLNPRGKIVVILKVIGSIKVNTYSSSMSPHN